MNSKINDLKRKFLEQSVDANFGMLADFIRTNEANSVVNYWKSNDEMFNQFKEAYILDIRTRGVYKYIVSYISCITFGITRGISNIFKPKTKRIPKEIIDRPFKYQYCWHLREYEADVFELFDNIEEYETIYSQLGDYKSKLVMVCMFMARITTDGNYFSKCADGRYWQYFDHEIIKVASDGMEVFVNCGGWIGDTVQNFISLYGDNHRIYCYEPGQNNIAAIHSNLDKFQDVILRPYGVGEKNSSMSYSAGVGYDGAICEDGKETINILSLDEDITEKITFINMDIEGFEIPALKGAKNHITEERPKLAICVYHLSDDIWKIGRLIKQYNPDYQLYLRHYRQEVKFETVLYAI